MAVQANHPELVCPHCSALLPEERREFAWCECGWNLPADPLNEMRGWERFAGKVSRTLGHLQNRQDAKWIRRNPTGSPSWIALSGLMYSIGILFILGAALLYMLLVGLAIFGILAIPQTMTSFLTASASR